MAVSFQVLLVDRIQEMGVSDTAEKWVRLHLLVHQRGMVVMDEVAVVGLCFDDEAGDPLA